MTLVLNEEQRLLKDTAKDFLTRVMPVAALRKLRDQKDELGFNPNHWQQMVELGWASMVLPEAYDGLDFGYMGLGAVIEESGRTLAASPLFSTVALGSTIIIEGGSEEQKSTFLPQIAAGALSLALALEEKPHHQPSNFATTAVADGDDYIINGEKLFVLDGHSADYLIIATRLQAGTGLFIVNANTDGIERRRHHLIDSRNAATVRFNQVRVKASTLIGNTEQGQDILNTAMDYGRICLAAEMLGAASECFERTVAYLKERDQFGVKIGSFQALKHRAAKMFIELELSKSVVLDALSAIDEKRADLPQLASLAKARLNDVFELITNEAVQMHGGIGVTDELDIGFFLKRSRVATQILGSSHFHRDRYASLCGY